MRAGKLRHQVVLQQRATGSPEKTESGAPDADWSDVWTTYAAIEPLRGKEFFDSQQVQSLVSVRIRIRYRAGITAAMRVKHGAVIYSIEAVINPESRNVELQLMCSQGANNG